MAHISSKCNSLRLMLFYQTPDHECDQFACFTKCLMLSLWGSRCCIDRRNVMDGKNRHFSLWNPWMSVSQCVCVCVCKQKCFIPKMWMPN